MNTPSVLVTGGAGFIGCTAARRYLDKGWRVVVLDTLYRRGSEQNLRWLQSLGPVHHVPVDVRDAQAVRSVIDNEPALALVLHMAAQSAVTTSVQNPREDLEINLLGTFNVLEALRNADSRPLLVYASTNKVYGRLEAEPVVAQDQRYAFAERPDGIGETMALDFHSPYGCSKGGADQYVRDYGRIYGIDTVVARQSCIYGPRQFGVEDQGWLAWFTIAAELGRPVTIYGDGKQVRDVLYVEDLIDVFEIFYDHRDQASGRVFNVGGGPANTLSLLELIERLETLTGRRIERASADWRPGDQPVYVSDIRGLEAEFAWRPRTDITEGLARLHQWVAEHRGVLQTFHRCV